jgi:hypothetical protein
MVPSISSWSIRLTSAALSRNARRQSVKVRLGHPAEVGAEGERDHGSGGGAGFRGHRELQVLTHLGVCGH